MAAISAVFVFAWFCTFVMFVFCVVCSDWITAIFPAFVFTWFFVVLYSVSFASSSQLPTFAVVFHKYPWFVFGASGKLLTSDKINVSDAKSYYTYFWSPSGMSKCVSRNNHNSGAGWFSSTVTQLSRSIIGGCVLMSNAEFSNRLALLYYSTWPIWGGLLMCTSDKSSSPILFITNLSEI